MTTGCNIALDINAYNAYNAYMAVLNIRNLPAAIYTRLRVRAAKAGQSMEAEAREILTAACREGDARRPAYDLQSLVDQLYGSAKPRRVVESLIDERRQEAATE
ncbi:MAG: hypothetical protein WEB85_11395 [Dongiaceae bacterium]